LKRWLVGFEHVTDGVVKSVDVIRHHPLLPRDVVVHGMLIHPETGELQLVVDGYAKM
jgi:carbonic anhydrase